MDIKNLPFLLHGSEDSLDKSFRKALLKGKLKRIIWLMKGTGKSAGKFSWNRLLK